MNWGSHRCQFVNLNWLDSIRVWTTLGANDLPTRPSRHPQISKQDLCQVEHSRWAWQNCITLKVTFSLYNIELHSCMYPCLVPSVLIPGIYGIQLGWWVTSVISTPVKTGHSYQDFDLCYQLSGISHCVLFSALSMMTKLSILCIILQNSCNSLQDKTADIFLILIILLNHPIQWYVYIYLYIGQWTWSDNIYMYLVMDDCCRYIWIYDRLQNHKQIENIDVGIENKSIYAFCFSRTSY